MPAQLPGIHHVTCITGDVQRNVDFYVSVLGLRFIKKTVNFDVPDTYHLYYADLVGTPGTAMTFFGWPHLPWGAQGAGQIREVSFAIPPEALDFWSARLRDLEVPHDRERRFDTEVITFADPDRMRLELVGDAAALESRWQAWDGGPIQPEHQIRGFHSVTLLERALEPTAQFLTGTLGFREAGNDCDRVRFTTGAGGASATVNVIADSAAPRSHEAVGTVHHVAWRATDEEHQLQWRAAVVEAGRDVTPVINRKYFRSIYFREPGGVLFEIATDGPGFTVDESVADLGSSLQLPPQYEERRENLNFNLPPIDVPSFART
ncbi:MAG TPA: ring-cleaving dioxygenase [Candidatus Dormibacteraeota bacterium]